MAASVKIVMWRLASETAQESMSACQRDANMRMRAAAALGQRAPQVELGLIGTVEVSADLPRQREP